MLHTKHLTFVLALAFVAMACDSAADLPDDSRADVLPEPEAIPVGALWGPCDLSDADSPDWWGCNGMLGEGLACLRPVSDQGLNICAPQTWDPVYGSDCENVPPAPFGLEVRVNGSAYCVADCETDDDCAGGMACSPTSHFCAWVGE